MLSRQGNAETTHLQMHRQRIAKMWRARVRVGVVVLACSLVSLTAFGQPPSSVERAPGVQIRSTDANIGPDVEPGRENPSALLQALQSKADSLRDKVAVIRELPNPAAVPLLPRNEAELHDYIVSQIDDKVLAQIAHEERILINVGVLDEGASYQELIIALLTEQVAGYYEPDEKGLYVLAGQLDESDVPVIAHELQHAAQDHHWDLGAILRPKWHQSDVLTARSSLVEGDAMLTMIAHSAGAFFPMLTWEVLDQAVELARKGAEEMSARYPRFVVDELLAPYVEGLVFAYTLYQDGGWDAVNASFEKLPLSSAQILYPERYLKGDEPTLLSFDLDTPDGANSWGERRHSDVWGMASMRHLFSHLLPKEAAQSIESATSGWKGDRIELWGTDTQEYLIWVSVFDSESSSQEFYSLLRQIIPSLVSKEPTCAQGKHGQHCGVVDGARGLLIEQWGDLSILVLANDLRADYREINTSEATRSERVLLRTAEQVFHTLRRSKYPALWR